MPDVYASRGLHSFKISVITRRVGHYEQEQYASQQERYSYLQHKDDSGLFGGIALQVNSSADRLIVELTILV